VELFLAQAPRPSASEGDVEVVERKGIGHPDTLCDGVAEAAANALARYYLERFGAILHHNVDKVLLVGGVSRASFGGGEIEEPIEITLAGRATRQVAGVAIPVDELVIEAARTWLHEHVPTLEDRHVELSARIRPGAPELVATFLRQARTGIWLANDTSIGVGYAPRTRLEQAVLEVERSIDRRAHPERGTDVKVMGVRHGDRVAMTIACAMVASELPSLESYRRACASLRDDVRAIAKTDDVTVNAADDLEAGDVYLTVSGTSAESGDDGEAGRGNRATGLITPMRLMTLESVAGKNPVSHVGKIYNVVAERIATSIANKVAGVSAAEVVLVSRIGAPVREPWLVHVRVRTEVELATLRAPIEAIARDHLGRTEELARAIVRSEIALF
jgi:S-adenosylmethionine synthetase